MIRKKLGIYVICFALVTSCLLGGAFAKKNQSHAIIGDWVATKCLDVAFNVVNAAFLKSVDTLSDKTNNEALKALCDFTASADNLLFAGSAEDASKEILAELAAIESQINNVDTAIQDTLNQMFTYDIQHNLKEIQGALDEVYHKHSDIMKTYNRYLESVNQYASAVVDENSGKVGSETVKKAEKDTAAKKKALDDYFEKDTFIKDMEQDLNSIAKRTCKYYPSADTNPKARGERNGYNVYLDEAWAYLDQTAPFEHQKYEAMTAAANDSAKDIELLLRVCRAWYDYQYANDGGQVESSAEKYQDIMNKSIHALSDISSQCDEKVGGFMRPYDLNVTKALDYAKEGTYTIWYIVYTFPPIPGIYGTKAIATKPEMDFYRVCVNGTPYLIQKDTGLNLAKYYVDNSWAAFYAQSQDYKNLIRTRDGLYSMPKSYSDVLPIIKTNAYKGASSNLMNYFEKKGKLDQLPKGNVLYVPTQDIDSVGTQDITSLDFHLDASWCSTSINADNPDKAKTRVNFHEIYKNSSDRVCGLMVGDQNNAEQSAVSVKLSDDRGSLTVTDEKGNDIKGKQVMAKTKLKLNLNIKEGAALKSLKWISADGKTKETIADGDIVDLAQPNKDGTYTFTYPMSYQDCTFRADFTNEEEGEGAEENPYLISSVQDLQDYLEKASEENDYNNAHYKLTADISYVEEKIKGGGRFHKFAGTFDGNGHSIEGHDSTLFDVITETGIVKNLNLVSKQNMISGDSAFARENYGLITGCSYSGAETGREYFSSQNGDFGIFARENGKTGIIRNCYNATTVRSDGSIGGIACNNQGTIINCYNTGSFAYYRNPDKKKPDAGIAVHNFGLVENCYDTGPVSRTSGSSPIVSNNGEDGNIADAFYSDRAGGAGFLGTLLKDSQMKGDYMLNILNKNVSKTEGLCQWMMKEGVNNGYPILGTVPDRYALSTDIKGKGSLDITDEADKEIHKAVSGAAVTVTATPGDGRQVDNLKLYDEKGKTIQKLEVKADEKGIVKTSFTMPLQNVAVHVKFVKPETPADVKQPEPDCSEADEKQPENSSPQKDGSGPVYDKAAFTDKNTGITVTGDEVDTRAVLKVTAYDETDPRHMEIEDAASDDVLASYDVSLALVDEQGKEIKSGTAKFKGTLDVAFPIKEADRDKSLKILHGSEDGLKFEDGGLAGDGLYHVEVSHLSPFAVVEYEKDLEANLSAGESLDSGNGGSAWIWIVIVCIAAAAIVIAMWIIRRRRTGKGE